MTVYEAGQAIWLARPISLVERVVATVVPGLQEHYAVEISDQGEQNQEACEVTQESTGGLLQEPTKEFPSWVHKPYPSKEKRNPHWGCGTKCAQACKKVSRQKVKEYKEQQDSELYSPHSVESPSLVD